MGGAGTGGPHPGQPPCTGGDYEQLKTRLKLCGMTGAEYEDAVRELREALDMV